MTRPFLKELLDRVEAMLSAAAFAEENDAATARRIARAAARRAR